MRSRRGTGTAQIGDLDKDGALAFTNGGLPGFDLADPDILIDGVVIARSNLYDANTVKPEMAAPFLFLV